MISSGNGSVHPVPALWGELAARFENYEPEPGDERPVEEYLLERASLARARSERQIVDAITTEVPTAAKNERTSTKAASRAGRTLSSKNGSKAPKTAAASAQSAALGLFDDGHWPEP